MGIVLNALSMVLVATVIEYTQALYVRILASFYIFFFVALEVWYYLIIYHCNMYATGYIVGKWYNSK